MAMRVLAVGAHPDDLEILCAGTLARYRQAGHDVVMAHLCNGDCGHFVIPSEELSAMRAGEAAKAAEVIGAELLSLGIGDCDLRADDLQARQGVVDLIREARPDVIITHTPDDYMPDHVATSELVFFASFAASLPHWRTGKDIPAHVAVPPIYYMDTLAGTGFIPEEYVDITPVFEKKLEMLKCHQSQVTWLQEHDGIDLEDFVTVMARARGLQCGVRYAEGFRQLRRWPRIVPRRLLPH
jgi:LmbE family N-acetylglucosaminyl deacetylase